MELPFHLKTLPPDALDVIRYYGTLTERTAHADEIADDVGLSERAFGKSIRRLVTKGYLQMDGDQIYRLTEQGQRAVDELSQYDDAGGDGDEYEEEAVEPVQRELVIAMPRNLIADEPTEIFVGFNSAQRDDTLLEPADLVVRLSVVNGQPDNTQEASFQLKNDTIYKTFMVTAGRYTRARLRIQVYQLGPNPDDIEVCGGMYVDVDVVGDFALADMTLTAYSASISITPPE